MFLRLPESQAKPQFRIGGSAASIVAHGALVATLVVLTASADHAISVDEEPNFDRVFQVQSPQVRQPPARVSANVSSSSASLQAATIAVPSSVPISIPDVDVNARHDVDADVLFGRSARPGDGASASASAANVIGSGNVFGADQVDKPVVLLPGSPGPAYPEALRVAGVSGEVRVRFVVDTAGRVDPESLEVLSSSHDQFTRSVRVTLERYRFLPAEYGGRRVRQLVELPFVFDLSR